MSFTDWPNATNDGPCVACLRPTDTALGFRGPAEWHIAALIVMGIPESQAGAMVASEPNARDSDWYEVTIRVCSG